MNQPVKMSHSQEGVVGLEQGTVRLTSFSSAWRILFEREKKILQVALGELAIEIQHIGSTAIPNMEAKPIIDIAARITGLDLLESCVARLERAGYSYKGEYGLPGRHFFVKGDPHTHYLHVVAGDSAHWAAWILFREILCGNPAVAKEYSTLKRGLAERYQTDRDAYTKAKGEFIVRTLARARAGTRA